MATKGKQSDHAALPTAKIKKRSIPIVTQFIGRFDRVYESDHPDVLMKMISGQSNIHSVAKAPVATGKGSLAWKCIAMKGSLAWKCITMKASVTKEGSEALVIEAVKEVVKEGSKALATQAAKKLGKEATEAFGTKAAKEVTEACATKWVPVFSFALGAAFGLYRVYCGIHLYSKGEKARCLEELGKAGLEVISGAIACIPGSGTGFSLVLDGFIAAWDFADTCIHDEEADKRKKKGKETLLRYDLTTIKKGIQSEEYSATEFASCMLREIIEKYPATDDDQKCVDFTFYLNLLIMQIRENSFFKNESAFFTESLLKEMEEIGFSKKQIGCFHVEIDRC